MSDRVPRAGEPLRTSREEADGPLADELESLLLTARAQAAHLRRTLGTVLTELDRTS